MSRAVLILDAPAEREKAIRWIGKAPPGTRIEFKEAKRTHEQNAKMWAMLTEVAQQLPWHGLKLSPDDWKLIFLDALKQEMRLVPNIGGTGFINLGRSSSDLSKDEMSNLIELMLAFGAEHGVAFADHASLTTPANDSTQVLAEREAARSDDQGGAGANNSSADGQAPSSLADRVNGVKVAMAKAVDTAALDAIWRRAGPLRKELEQADPEGLLVDLSDAYEAAGRGLEG